MKQETILDEIRMKSLANFTSSLRELADWYDDNPEMPLPVTSTFNVFVSGDSSILAHGESEAANV